MYSLVPLIANYVFNKALGEGGKISVCVIYCGPASRGLRGQISRTFFPVRKCTNIYGNRTEPARLQSHNQNHETYKTFIPQNKLKVSHKYSSGFQSKVRHGKKTKKQKKNIVSMSSSRFIYC